MGSRPIIKYPGSAHCANIDVSRPSMVMPAGIRGFPPCRRLAWRPIPSSIEPIVFGDEMQFLFGDDSGQERLTIGIRHGRPKIVFPVREHVDVFLVDIRNTRRQSPSKRPTFFRAARGPDSEGERSQDEPMPMISSGKRTAHEASLQFTSEQPTRTAAPKQDKRILQGGNDLLQRSRTAADATRGPNLSPSSPETNTVPLRP